MTPERDGCPREGEDFCDGTCSECPYAVLEEVAGVGTRGYAGSVGSEDMSERWFDGDYSECYFGMGHQPRDEFAAWITEHEMSEHGATLEDTREWVDPWRVEYEWVRWIDEEPHERFETCEPHAMGAFAISRHRL